MFKINFPIVRFLEPNKSTNSCLIFWEFNIIGTSVFFWVYFWEQKDQMNESEKNDFEI